MSHALMSASEMGWPRPTEGSRPFLSAANDEPERRASAATVAAREILLDVDMLDLSLGIYPPAGEAVVVLTVEAQRVGYGFQRLAALGDEFRPQRLPVAGIVPGAAR